MARAVQTAGAGPATAGADGGKGAAIGGLIGADTGMP